MATAKEILKKGEVIRANMRTAFLKVMHSLVGEPCKLLTYELSTPYGQFLGWNPDGSEILMAEMKTPANIDVPAARIRTHDIVTMHFDKLMYL